MAASENTAVIGAQSHLLGWDTKEDTTKAVRPECQPPSLREQEISQDVQNAEWRDQSQV